MMKILVRRQVTKTIQSKEKMNEINKMILCINLSSFYYKVESTPLFFSIHYASTMHFCANFILMPKFNHSLLNNLWKYVFNGVK